MQFQTQNRKVIQTVSGNIGSRKTLTTLQWYDELVSQNMGCSVPVTIATPTNGLSKQYRDLIASYYGFPCMVISQEEGYRSASEEYARQCELGYQGALIVNHKTALNTETDTSDRLLIIDEVFSPIQTIRIKFQSPEDLNRLSVQEVHDVDGYYELISSDDTNDMVENVKDDEGVTFFGYGKRAQDLGKLVNDEHYRVVIDKASFDAAASGESFEKSKSGNVILQFTIFMLPSIVDRYKDVLIISAEFDQTLLALMWAKDVNFQPNEWIESKLDRDYLTRKAPSVQLYNAPVRNLSKHFFTSIGNNDRDKGNQLFLDLVTDCISDMFPGKSHIFCTNEPESGKPYRWKRECPCGGQNDSCQCDGYGRRVIVNPHGWNHLKHYHMGVFMAGINFDPETETRLFDFYGITRDQAKEALCYQMVIQFLGRTSIRDRDSDNPIILIAPDEGAANYIQRLLKCAPSTPLPIDFEKRPRKTRSDKKEKTLAQKRAENAERKRRSRAAQKAPVELHL